MDEAERLAIWQRSMDLLAATEGIGADLEQRASANREARQRASSAPPAAEAPQAEPVRERASTAADWDAWNRWAEAIVDRKLDGLMPILGQAIAEIEREERRGIDGEIDKLRAETKAQIDALAELLTAIEARLVDLEASAIRKSRPKLVAGGPPDAA